MRGEGVVARSVARLFNFKDMKVSLFLILVLFSAVSCSYTKQLTITEVYEFNVVCRNQKGNNIVIDNPNQFELRTGQRLYRKPLSIDYRFDNSPVNIDLP